MNGFDVGKPLVMPRETELPGFLNVEKPEKAELPDYPNIPGDYELPDFPELPEKNNDVESVKVAKGCDHNSGVDTMVYNERIRLDASYPSGERYGLRFRVDSHEKTSRRRSGSKPAHAPEKYVPALLGYSRGQCRVGTYARKPHRTHTSAD